MPSANALRPRGLQRVVHAGRALLFVVLLPGAGTAQVSELQVAPSQLQIQPGERKSLLVTAFDAVGNVVTNAEFSLTADESVVRVIRDQTAPNIVYVEGLARGRVSVKVTSNGVSGSADVTVLGPDLTGIPLGSGETVVLRIEPETIFLLPTEEVQLRPVFLGADGSPAARTTVVWRSLLETVATVNASGLVVGISSGQGVIEVEGPTGVVGRALVRVDNAPLAFKSSRLSLAPLDSDTLQVLVTDQENRAVLNRQLRWGSSDPSVVNVSPLGVVTGIRAGSANVVIQGFGQQHEIPVTVHRRVATMEISPPRGDVTLPLGGTVEFEAVLAAEDGSPVPEAPLIWENSDPAVASLDRATGHVTGITEGVTTLRVSGPEEGLQAAWSVRVVAGGIAVDFDDKILSKGRTVPVPVWIHDTAGNRLQRADRVVWSTTDSTVAFVTDDGLQTVGWGSTHLVATTPWGGIDSIHAVVQGELLVTSTRSGNSGLYSLEPEVVHELNSVADMPGAELDGAYSRDGRSIVYAATGESNTTELYIVNADATNARRITTADGNKGSPAWLADGRIVYQKAQAGVSQIWTIDSSGANPQQLTAGRRSSDQPDVSPDGTRVAFRQDDQIYVLGPDGAVVQVTEDDRNRNPHWFPDGSLGYVVERRIDRTNVRVIVKHDLDTNVALDISPVDWSVIDWAVAADGETFAIVVQQQINEVLTQGMWIVRIADGVVGEPVELPRTTELEQFLFPSFRW